MNSMCNKWRTVVPIVRQFSSGRVVRDAVAKENIHPNYLKLKKTQQKFQKDDGLRIHRKNGTPDTVLFYLSSGLGVVVMAQILYYWGYRAYQGRDSFP